MPVADPMTPWRRRIGLLLALGIAAWAAWAFGALDETVAGVFTGSDNATPSGSHPSGAHPLRNEER